MKKIEGFPSPMTSLVLLLSRLMALKPSELYDVAARRKKNDSDTATAGLPRGRGISARDFAVPGPGGEIPVRLYKKASSGCKALIIYLHGGGWTLGNLDSHEPVACGMCRASGAAVLSVEYRLAPEHPYPAALDDAMAAYRWARKNAESLGASGQRIFVAGDSAGANLCSVLCIECREADLPQPAGQILICPATDLSRIEGESYRKFESGYLLTKADMEWFVSLYCKDIEKLDHRVSPLLAGDLSGLASAMVITAQFDVLRDEGEAYAARLKSSGVRVWHKRFKGTIHCFTSMGRFVPAAGKAFGMIGRFVNGDLPPDQPSPDLSPRS